MGEGIAPYSPKLRNCKRDYFRIKPPAPESEKYSHWLGLGHMSFFERNPCGKGHGILWDWPDLGHVPDMRL